MVEGSRLQRSATLVFVTLASSPVKAQPLNVLAAPDDAAKAKMGGRARPQ